MSDGAEVETCSDTSSTCSVSSHTSSSDVVDECERQSGDIAEEGTESELEDIRGDDDGGSEETEEDGEIHLQPQSNINPPLPDPISLRGILIKQGSNSSTRQCPKQVSIHAPPSSPMVKSDHETRNSPAFRSGNRYKVPLLATSQYSVSGSPEFGRKSSLPDLCVVSRPASVVGTPMSSANEKRNKFRDFGRAMTSTPTAAHRRSRGDVFSFWRKFVTTI